MNLTEFRQQVNKQGLARSNRWVCRVNPPAGLTQFGRFINDQINQSNNRQRINLPGLDLNLTPKEQLENLGLPEDTTSIDRNFSTPTLGYSIVNINGVLNSLNLYCNGASIPERDMLNSEFFEYGEIRQLGVKHTHSPLVLNYYCSEDLRERLFFEQWQNLIFNPETKKHSYYKDYISTVDVIKYDAGWLNPVAQYRFYEAYPTNVGETALNYDDQSLVQLAIRFNFRNYKRVL